MFVVKRTNQPRNLFLKQPPPNAYIHSLLALQWATKASRENVSSLSHDQIISSACVWGKEHFSSDTLHGLFWLNSLQTLYFPMWPFTSGRGRIFTQLLPGTSRFFTISRSWPQLWAALEYRYPAGEEDADISRINACSALLFKQRAFGGLGAKLL